MISWSICLWFASLSIVFSRSIHVTANGRISFCFWLSITSLCMYTPHVLYPFICWRAFGLLPYVGYCKWCCSNIGVHVFFFTLVFSFFKYVPRSGIAIAHDNSVSYDNPVFSFLRNLCTVCTVKPPVYISTSIQEGSLFSTPRSTVGYLYALYNGHSDRWEVTASCGFDSLILIKAMPQIPHRSHTERKMSQSLESLALSPHSWGLGRTLRNHS